MSEGIGGFGEYDFYGDFAAPAADPVSVPPQLTSPPSAGQAREWDARPEPEPIKQGLLFEPGPSSAPMAMSGPPQGRRRAMPARGPVRGYGDITPTENTHLLGATLVAVGVGAVVGA